MYTIRRKQATTTEYRKSKEIKIHAIKKKPFPNSISFILRYQNLFFLSKAGRFCMVNYSSHFRFILPISIAPQTSKTIYYLEDTSSYLDQSILITNFYLCLLYIYSHLISYSYNFIRFHPIRLTRHSIS